ncbi:transposase (plasmid) [Pseudomonas sp. DTU_2021_1001937_2_SI_NGA_ILE_001]|uniref:REP-associated tyrosine transposase n=1 Tax=Pseudomonas sp. DTU_2021_1001937_2_SI_NGA_ILE_001 TaxID=3077589 RepID=UPI0028FC2B94|nr:transposase [Pseudomonas sp. DTU_2021_1001937_2_SI_NGA_ILE_001]WNW14427.1 transposase [Pseudomonas sp. DTU_2021_1001937_2_SI_NGA_ILE_001]
MARAASHKLRKGRFSAEGQAYMVTTILAGREPVFGDWQLGRLLVAELRQAESLGLADSLAWVVMPDHLHWLLVLRRAPLARLVQRVKSRSARTVNQARAMQGRLWQNGFHDKAIRREEDLQHLARYIITNPLRAGLVNRVGDYPLWDAVWLQQ